MEDNFVNSDPDPNFKKNVLSKPKPKIMKLKRIFNQLNTKNKSSRQILIWILTNPDPESLKKILFSPSAYNLISLLRFLLKEAFM